MTEDIPITDTLRHIADDHPCCAIALRHVCARIEELEMEKVDTADIMRVLRKAGRIMSGETYDRIVDWLTAYNATLAAGEGPTKAERLTAEIMDEQRVRITMLETANMKAALLRGEDLARIEELTTALRDALCDCAPRQGDDVPLDNVAAHHDWSCKFRAAMQPALLWGRRSEMELTPDTLRNHARTGFRPFDEEICALADAWSADRTQLAHADAMIAKQKARIEAWQRIGDELHAARGERAIARTRAVFDLLDELYPAALAAGKEE